MAKDPAFLFYPNDYLGGTMGMTFEEKGAYIELLMMQFNRGHMTEHMIIHMIGNLWESIKIKFIKDDAGLWYNRRLEEEQLKRSEYSESRRKNRTSVKHMKKHMSLHMENENVNKDVIINKDEKITCLTFDEFWNLYDKKVGDKTKLIHKYDKIKESDRLLIKEHIPKYKEAKPEKRFRKDPQTYLNNKSWLDEIISDNQKQQQIEPIYRPVQHDPIIINT